VKALLYIALAALALTSCRKEKLPDGTPSCIEQRVEQMRDQQLQNPPMRVVEYEYMGNTVYYIPASDACCDLKSELWDRECSLLCNPDEGLNNGTDSCPDFHALRTAGVVIWQDPREE